MWSAKLQDWNREQSFGRSTSQGSYQVQLKSYLETFSDWSNFVVLCSFCTSYHASIGSYLTLLWCITSFILTMRIASSKTIWFALSNIQGEKHGEAKLCWEREIRQPRPTQKCPLHNRGKNTIWLFWLRLNITVCFARLFSSSVLNNWSAYFFTAT